MNDRRIAAAELLDTHGDQIFRYCLSLLRSREIAQIALRDTLLAAQAHLARLTGPQDPESFDPWLYSLARGQCRRYQAGAAALGLGDAGQAPGGPGQDDAGSRRLAWHAAMSLEADEFEALELACRHDVDPGLVLGLPAGEASALLARARQRLERALGAEILAHRGRACPGLAEMLSGLPAALLAEGAGPVTAPIRERVLEHAAGCAACAGNWPHNVSAARVFALLPAPALSPLARAELLDSCAGHQPAAARVQGSLVLRPAVQPARRPPRGSRGRVLIAAAGATASAAVIASAFVLAGAEPAAVRGTGTAAAAGPPPGPALQAAGPGALGYVSPSAPVRARSARSSRSRLATPPPLVSTAGGRSQVLITAATQPLPARSPATRDSGPGQPAGHGTGGTPASRGTLQLSTASVNVGTGSAGRITLTAVGGAVSWSASSSAPGRVSVSSSAGTLQAGQSVTVTVTVTRGAGQGSATLAFESPPSAPQLVQVSWAALPDGSGRWHQPPSPSAPAPSPSPSAPPATASPSPSSSSS